MAIRETTTAVVFQHAASRLLKNSLLVAATDCGAAKQARETLDSAGARPDMCRSRVLKNDHDGRFSTSCYERPVDERCAGPAHLKMQPDLTMPAVPSSRSRVMKSHSFLDQLLRTASQTLGGAAGGTPGSTGGAPGTGSRPVLNADFGKGALAGGALGLLLGNRKARKLGGRLAMYGGVAAVGMLAYRAYGDWKKNSEVAAGAAELPPRMVHALPAPEAEEHCRGMLTALVAAAKADGHVDTREREMIEAEFERIGAAGDERAWLQAELQKPLDPAEVARAATSPEMAAEMYLASLLAADEQNFMERAYLDELARQLGIDAALKARLEAEMQQAVAGG
jgi:uncharacterized membrane protein YebE (DUF533 family)